MVWGERFLCSVTSNPSALFSLKGALSIIPVRAIHYKLYPDPTKGQAHIHFRTTDAPREFLRGRGTNPTNKNTFPSGLRIKEYSS